MGRNVSKSKEPTSRDLQAKASREALLAAAIDLMEEHGYDGVSVSEICGRCGLAKSTFYTHFGSKKDIIATILADVNKRMFDGHRWDDQLPIQERLLDYAKTYLSTIREQGKDFTKSVLGVILERTFDERTVEADRHREFVMRILTEGRREGILNTQKADATIAVELQALFYGLMVSWCIGDFQDIEEAGLRVATAYVVSLDTIK